MRQEDIAGLDGFISVPHQAYCYDFISEWLYCGGYIYACKKQDIGQFGAKLNVGNAKIKKTSSNPTVTDGNINYYAKSELKINSLIVT